MKISTFYEIYYKHRFIKADFSFKIYLLMTMLTRFLFNVIFSKKKINLIKLEVSNPDLLSKNLSYLFEYFNSDKGSFYFNQYTKSIKREKIEGHEYAQFYDKHFIDFKEDKLNILELGSFKGGGTAALSFFFRNSRIYSGDLYPDIFNFISNRIINFKIDTGSKNSINNVIINNNLRYDIIVEDAGHYLKDQIISLFLLFKKLKSKGFFIIEELDFPDSRKDMNIYNEKPTLREILHSIKNKKDFHSSYINYFDKKYFLDNYEFINIYKGRVNEIAFIKKR